MTFSNFTKKMSQASRSFPGGGRTDKENKVAESGSLSQYSETD